MSDDIVMIAAPLIAALSMGGYYFMRWFGSANAKARRDMRRVPRVSIASFPEGRAGRVVGTIEAHEGKTVIAPMSGEACVAYSILVEEEQGTGRSKHWETIIQDFDAVAFIVNDDAGRALVRAAGSWPAPEMKVVRQAGLFTHASPDLEAFLAKHGHSAQGLIFRKTLRCYEGVLAVGEKVAVVGIGKRETDPVEGEAPGGYRGKPSRLVIESLDDGRLLMSNARSVLR